MWLCVSRLFTTVDGREVNIVKEETMTHVTVVRSASVDGTKMGTTSVTTSKRGTLSRLERNMSKRSISNEASTSAAQVVSNNALPIATSTLNRKQSILEMQLLEESDEEKNKPACPVELEFADDIVDWWKNSVPKAKEFFSYPRPINDADHRIDTTLYTIIMIGDIALINYYDNLTLHYFLMVILFFKVISGPRIDPVGQLTVRFIGGN
jgi:hypothetical protein